MFMLIQATRGIQLVVRGISELLFVILVNENYLVKANFDIYLAILESSDSFAQTCFGHGALSEYADANEQI